MSSTMGHSLMQNWPPFAVCLKKLRRIINLQYPQQGDRDCFMTALSQTNGTAIFSLPMLRTATGLCTIGRPRSNCIPNGEQPGRRSCSRNKFPQISRGKLSQSRNRRMRGAHQSHRLCSRGNSLCSDSQLVWQCSLRDSVSRTTKQRL